MRLSVASVGVGASPYRGIVLRTFSLVIVRGGCFDGFVMALQKECFAMPVCE